MRYPRRHSTYGRVKVKTIQLFLGKDNIHIGWAEESNTQMVLWQNTCILYPPTFVSKRFCYGHATCYHTGVVYDMFLSAIHSFRCQGKISSTFVDDLSFGIQQMTQVICMKWLTECTDYTDFNRFQRLKPRFHWLASRSQNPWNLRNLCEIGLQRLE